MTGAVRFCLCPFKNSILIEHGIVIYLLRMLNDRHRGKPKIGFVHVECQGDLDSWFLALLISGRAIRVRHATSRIIVAMYKFDNL